MMESDMQVTDAAVLVDFAVVSAVMLSASRSDMRSREVSDRHWQILSVAGPVLYFVFCVGREGLRWESAANLLGMLCAACCFTSGGTRWDLPAGVVSAVSAAAVLFLGERTALDMGGVMSQIMVLVYFLLYVLGILRGGADAKCLIALSVSMPVYYDVWHIPLIEGGRTLSAFFVPSLSVLLSGAVAATVWCVVWFFSEKEGGRREGFSYVMDIDAAERSFVWPLEDIVDGEKRYTGTCSDEEMPEVYARLRAHGEKEVAVSYMIPFIAPLAAAAVFTMFVGNPMFLI